MSEYGTISARVRHGQGKGAARTLRRTGEIPAIMYGSGGENISLALNPNDFRKATDPTRAWNTLYSVTVQEEGKPDQVQSCMVADVQIDSVRRNVIHLDFMRVDPEKEIVRKIQVEYTGRSVGVVAGGKLRSFRRFVKVACKPGNIPVKLSIDVTPIEAGQSVRMKDVQVEGARLVEHPEQRLIFVELPKAAREEEGDEGETKEKEEEKK